MVCQDITSYYLIAEPLIILQTSHFAAQKMMKTQSTNSKRKLPIIILVDFAGFKWQKWELGMFMHLWKGNPLGFIT